MNVVFEYGEDGVLGKYKEDVKKLGEGLTRVLIDAGLDPSKARLKVSTWGDKFSLSYSDNDKEIDIDRSFTQRWDGKLTVRHDYQVLSENLQGKGLSKAIMRQMVKLYDKMGVDLIEVHANIDIGGYTWGRYGFNVNGGRDFATDFVARQVKGGHREEAIKIVDNFYKTHDVSTSFPMNDIAKQPRGKEALLGTSWDGHINLKDPVSSKQFRTYIQKKK